MTPKASVCQAIEQALLATAIGDADTATAARVDAHTRTCAVCREDFGRYRAIDGAVGAWREAPAPAEELARACHVARRRDLARHARVSGIFPAALRHTHRAVCGGRVVQREAWVGGR